MICSVDGCDKQGGRSGGMCNKHYIRMRRHGTTQSEKPVLRADESWKEHAACTDEDPALFFPDLSVTRRDYNRAVLKAQLICLGCPVIGECLHYALVTDARYGVWGGATEIDRARLTGRKRVH